MGEVVLARTSPTLHPPSPPTVLSLSCLKFHSASIVVTSTVRVKMSLIIYNKIMVEILIKTHEQYCALKALRSMPDRKRSGDVSSFLS